MSSHTIMYHCAYLLECLHIHFGDPFLFFNVSTAASWEPFKPGKQLSLVAMYKQIVGKKGYYQLPIFPYFY